MEIIPNKILSSGAGKEREHILIL